MVIEVYHSFFPAGRTTTQKRAEARYYGSSEEVSLLGSKEREIWAWKKGSILTKEEDGRCMSGRMQGIFKEQRADSAG